ncbi:MAG: hypothetical protein ABJC63_08255 [Gemmatimonadales bacterium]
MSVRSRASLSGNHLLRVYPPRALMLWLALHAFIAAVSGGEIVAFGTPATIVLAIVGAAVGKADTRRRREYGMLGNLGIPKGTPSGIWAGTMVVLETCLRVSVYLIGESR